MWNLLISDFPRRWMHRADSGQLLFSDLFLDSETPLIGELYTAQFKGAALFSQAQGQMEVPSEEIYDCQKIAFLRDDLLLESFQGSDSTGLGTAVVDAQAYVVNNPNSGSSSSSDDSLELVIIIAIVIACVAFLFLIFAIFWAWRYDKRNRRAFLAENRKSTTDETFDAGDSPESKEKPMVKTQTNNKKTPVLPSYPSVIGGESQADGGVYPESVISEDIHSSLSQYYTGGAAGNYNYSNGRLQDAASVSSMESYGYSLDGYTQSVSTPMPTKLLPTEPANTDSWMDTKDLRTDDESGNDWGVSTDYEYSLKSALDGPGVIVSGDLPTDEEEMPPPSDIEDQSMLESMMDESAIHTAVFTADDR